MSVITLKTGEITVKNTDKVPVLIFVIRLTLVYKLFNKIMSNSN